MYATDVESGLFSWEVDWQQNSIFAESTSCMLYHRLPSTNISLNGKNQLERMGETRQTRVPGEWRIASQMSREGIAQRRTTHPRTN